MPTQVTRTPVLVSPITIIQVRSRSRTTPPPSNGTRGRRRANAPGPIGNSPRSTGTGKWSPGTSRIMWSISVHRRSSVTPRPSWPSGWSVSRDSSSNRTRRRLSPGSGKQRRAGSPWPSSGSDTATPAVSVSPVPGRRRRCGTPPQDSPEMRSCSWSSE